MKLSKEQNEWLTAMLEYPSNVVSETNPQLAEWLEAQLHEARQEGVRAAVVKLWSDGDGIEAFSSSEVEKESADIMAWLEKKR